tara:strand:+ start:41689 stop:42258 length:570 start_codon:yes stop_codon:yes gene_type:complete
MARGKEQRPAEILVDRIRARATDRIVVLVDGPACSGKTTLADEIAYALKAQLVHMDAFYPGWGGLEVGSSIVSSSLLAAESPGYHRWDWATGKQAEWHKVNPRKHLVIEGSGALSAENLALATYGVWIHLPLLERRERKRLRDGSLNMEHWDFWAMQERAFYQRERPDLIAHTVLDSGSNVLSPEKTDD